MKKTKREHEIRQAAVEHEWPVVFDDIFAEGAEWADSHPNWISVEDEMPKEDGRYLFYHATIGVQLAYYYNDLTLDKAVTHWMPLPAPPIGDKTSPVESSSEKPNNCKKLGIPGYENVVIHEGNAKGGML